MNANKISQLETLLERKFSEEEIARLRRIKDVLGISDDDALWDILAAMEYQRTYYEKLPQKIAEAAAEILQKISVTAEKELADSVVEQAEKLAGKLNLNSLIPLGVLALVCLLSFGSLLLWAGFCLGTGQAHPPSLLLRMPSGLVISALCLTMGLLMGFQAAQNYAYGGKGKHRRLLLALAFVMLGGITFSFSLSI